MLKSLGLCCMPESAMVASFKLPEYVATRERNRTYFLESETTKECISLKASPVKSKSTSPFSLSVIYQKIHKFRNGDLNGHIFSLPLRHLNDTKLQVVERKIPKQFLATEETFSDYITMVLSESCLVRSIQKRLVTHISELEAFKARSFRKGFKIEVEIKVKVDLVVNIGCGCKGKEACPWPLGWEKHVATRVVGMDCPICLTELSSSVSRMELLFSCFPHKLYDEVAQGEHFMPYLSFRTTWRNRFYLLAFVRLYL